MFSRERCGNKIKDELQRKCLLRGYKQENKQMDRSSERLKWLDGSKIGEKKISKRRKIPE